MREMTVAERVKLEQDYWRVRFDDLWERKQAQLDEIAAERDRYRDALRKVSARSADLVRKSYNCAVDEDGDWVRAHAAKTAEVSRDALTPRATGGASA